MPEDGQVSELLLQWHEARERGEDVSLTILCREHPELLDDVREAIASLSYMETLLSDGRSESGGNEQDGNHSSDTDQFPRMLAGYEIIEVLGRGGMGVVYRAHQNDLHRFVALKMLNDTHCPADRIARFRTESQSVAQLQHPNIVQIYDVGESAGKPYYAMELVTGGSLAKQLVENSTPPQQAAKLVKTLARGIHAAHVRGIVHRDLKPANVLLTDDGTPKIADFGLAKRLDDDSRTRQGEILGTPCYMAPEQAEGKNEHIGPAVDVYALGAILFEMLTGNPPFKAATAMESLRRLTTEDAAMPREMRGRIPKDLEAICLKCLEKSPERRYATAEDLANDLARFLESLPIHARRIGYFRRLGKWAKRRSDLAILTVVLIAIGFMTLFFVGKQSWDRRQQRLEAIRLAPQAREILKRNCYECHGADPQAIERDLNVLDHASQIENDRDIVIPGHPDDSRLIQRIADGSMPPEEDEVRLPRVSQKELTILRKWIAGGAPAFPEEDPSKPTPPVVSESAIARRVKHIFHRRCYQCHNYEVAKGGIKILHHRQLLVVRKVVVPGEPNESELYNLIAADPDDKRVMPPQPAERLSASEIEAVRQWIAEGAQPFPKD